MTIWRAISRSNVIHILPMICSFGSMSCNAVAAAFSFDSSLQETRYDNGFQGAFTFFQCMSFGISLASLVGASAEYRRGTDAMCSCGSWFAVPAFVLCLVASLMLSFKHAVVLEQENPSCSPECEHAVESAELATWLATVMAILAMISWCTRSCAILENSAAIERPSLIPQGRDWPQVLPAVSGLLSVCPEMVAIGFIGNRNLKNSQAFGKTVVIAIILLLVFSMLCHVLSTFFALFELRSGRRQMCNVGCSMAGGALISTTLATLVTLASYASLETSNTEAFNNTDCLRDTLCGTSAYNALLALVVATLLNISSMFGWSCAVSYAAGEIAGHHGMKAFSEDARHMFPFATFCLSAISALVAIGFLSHPLLTSSSFVGGSGWIIALEALAAIFTAPAIKLSFRELFLGSAHPFSYGMLLSILSTACSIAASAAIYVGNVNVADDDHKRNRAADHALAACWAASSSYLVSLYGICCSRSYVVGDIIGRNDQLL